MAIVARRGNTSAEKWMYSPGERLSSFIVVDGAELLCIRQWTETAEQAYLMCINNNKIPATIRHCITPDGEQHSVCQIGSFAIDHREEWPVKIEDLDYTWIT